MNENNQDQNTNVSTNTLNSSTQTNNTISTEPQRMVFVTEDENGVTTPVGPIGPVNTGKFDTSIKRPLKKREKVLLVILLIVIIGSAASYLI